MQRKNLKFIQGVDFELIENLLNNGTKYLLIFDDSCKEISISKQFVKVATAEDTGDCIHYILSITCFIKANWDEMLSYKIHI